MSCGVGGRHSSDLALLWLCCRLVVTALIPPLAWEPPYAAGVDLKRKKKKERKGIPSPFAVQKQPQSPQGLLLELWNPDKEKIILNY